MKKQFTPSERRELAAQAGINAQYLWQCLTGRREMGPTEARRVETATGGVVTRQMICQKTWQGIWPELAEPSAADHGNPPTAGVAVCQPGQQGRA